MAYLPPGWIGQNLFGYVQPMVVGYCVCCPESSETMLADMREMGPTYFLATPRVLEALLTQVSMRMEDSGGFNQRLYRGAWPSRSAPALASWPARRSDRRPSRLRTPTSLFTARFAMCSGMSKLRVAYTAGDASPRTAAVLPRLGHQPEAALWLNRNGLLRRDAA